MVNFLNFLKLRTVFKKQHLKLVMLKYVSCIIDALQKFYMKVKCYQIIIIQELGYNNYNKILGCRRLIKIKVNLMGYLFQINVIKICPKHIRDYAELSLW